MRSKKGILYGNDIEDDCVMGMINETNRRVKAFEACAQNTTSPKSTAKAILLYSCCLDSLQSIWSHESYNEWRSKDASKSQLLSLLKTIDKLGTNLPRVGLQQKHKLALNGLLKLNSKLIRNMKVSTMPNFVPPPPPPPPKYNPPPDKPDEYSCLSPCCKCVIL